MGGGSGHALGSSDSAHSNSHAQHTQRARRTHEHARGRQVLLMTLQGPPPQLEAQCGRRHFSRAMREVVALSLVKDPKERPSAAQLLQHRCVCVCV